MYVYLSPHPLDLLGDDCRAFVLTRRLEPLRFLRNDRERRLEAMSEIAGRRNRAARR
jgi:hypothetical protein